MPVRVGEERMWIGLNDGWLSIVENWNNDDELLVRARKLIHLTNVFPDCDYFKDSDADYPYRAYISREQVGETIKQRLMATNYTNFKASVEDTQMKALYAEMWNLVYFRFINDR